MGKSGQKLLKNREGYGCKDLGKASWLEKDQEGKLNQCLTRC
jgi:hypothetical protein